MHGFYKIAAATPRLNLGDPAANAKVLVRLAKEAAKDGVAAIVFPELSITLIPQKDGRAKANFRIHTYPVLCR